MTHYKSSNEKYACIQLMKFLAIISMVSCAQSQEHLENRQEIHQDPDVYLDVSQSVRRYGYQAETHTVLTEDGYILKIHRIPRTSNRFHDTDRLPVFIQHGLAGSSYLWILQGPEKALAYYLADEGYDVWLGNARGNPYSRAHTTLPPSSPVFWNFSFHEMGVYDLPAVIDHILNVTGAPQLNYIGHSMGTTMFFVMSAMNPQMTAKIASMHALAPVVFASNIKTAMRRLAKYANDVQFLTMIMGNGELLPETRFLKYLTRLGCELLLKDKRLCVRYDFAATGGSDPDQYNASLTPLLLSHPGNGASTKTAVHYLQLIKTGKFQQFDYGTLGNIVIYNATTPPQYNLSEVKVPIYLYYARGDPTADPADVEILYEKLLCTKEKYVVPWPKFNHMDFIVAKDAKSLVYAQIMRQLNGSEIFGYQSDDFEVIMVP